MVTEGVAPDQAVVLEVHYRWGVLAGERTLRDASVELGGVEVPKDRTAPPRGYFLPREWRRRFGRIYGEISDLLRTVAVPIGAGRYVVPVSQLDSLLRELERIEGKLRALVEELEAQWPDIVEDARATWNDRVWSSFASLRTLRPSDVVRLEWRVMPLLPGQDYDRLLGHLSAETARAVQQRIEQYAAQIGDCLASEPLNRLEEAVRRLAERLENDSVKLTSGAFREVYEALSLLQNMQGLVRYPQQLSDSVRQLRELVERNVPVGGRKPVELSPQTGQAFRRLFSAVGEAIANAREVSRGAAGIGLARSVRVRR